MQIEVYNAGDGKKLIVLPVSGKQILLQPVSTTIATKGSFTPSQIEGMGEPETWESDLYGMAQEAFEYVANSALTVDKARTLLEIVEDKNSTNDN